MRPRRQGLVSWRGWRPISNWVCSYIFSKGNRRHDAKHSLEWLESRSGSAARRGVGSFCRYSIKVVKPLALLDVAGACDLTFAKDVCSSVYAIATSWW